MFNLDECADIYAMIAQAMGTDTKGLSDMEAGEAAGNALWDLTKKLGIPQKLSEAGVPEDGLEAVADMSMSDGAIVYNPKIVFDSAVVLDILKKAY
jgi:lactaldehyde reductase